KYHLAATLLCFIKKILWLNDCKILVFPVEGSHWINMLKIIEVLHTRGHEIVVLRMSPSWYVKEKSSLYTCIDLPTTSFEENFEVFVSQQLKIRLQAKSFWSRMWANMQMRSLMVEQFNIFHQQIGDLIIKILEDKDLIQKLRNARYDLFLTDPGHAGGTILAKYLKLPLVNNARWTVQGEAHFDIAPSPLSYVPFTATELTDKMTFLQRVKNCISSVLGRYTMATISEPVYKPILSKYFGADVDYSAFMADADIWLMRNDFIFEYPRPTMPNVVYMSGFQCKPPKALPADLEEFVQSSGDHGVILMSMGTLVSQLPSHVTEEIAAAFAQLPQKVIWRYLGQRPASLGNNTLLVKWFPQNDLLGHPKTRVFLTHGGTNGLQEAIYHGIPIVGIPIFFDQPENLSRIRAKGGAVIVDVAEVDRQVLGQALNTVLNEASYTENMRRLSWLHKDQPLSPMDQAVFWIEFVIRHKGAPHLKSHSHTLSWAVYHSLDVISALLCACLFFIYTFVYVGRAVWRRNFRRNKVKQG
uniref:UDP-glucuronosyltransferase n=1 Tax=Periophthalmus magnuspinnatus TaxID=409849 RepID=A0A3B3ZUD5_9GOBI